MKMTPPEHDLGTDHVAELCPELRLLLDQELAAGNRVRESSRGGPRDSVIVLLQHPFRTRPESLPPGVTYREIEDPHWWKAEYVHEPTKHVLACPF